jgi:uncharacterized coiled-coil protein SlyX
VSGNLEDRIQQLCAQVVATQDDEELNRLCTELRDALNRHIAFLRKKVAEYRNSSGKKAPRKGDEEDVR